MSHAEAADESVVRGVTEAWDFWMSQHPVSLQGLIETALKDSIQRWLEDHRDDVIAAISDLFPSGDQEEVPPSSGSTLDTGEVVARLRVLRQDRKLTVKQVAEASGLKQAVLYHLEEGHRQELTYAELCAWSAALGYSVHQVISPSPIVLASA